MTECCIEKRRLFYFKITEAARFPHNSRPEKHTCLLLLASFLGRRKYCKKLVTTVLLTRVKEAQNCRNDAEKKVSATQTSNAQV